MIPMDPYERLFIFTLVPIHFISLLIAIIFLMVVIFRSEKGNIKRSFIIVHSLIIIWLIGKIIKTVAPTLPIRWGANVFYYLGVMPLGPSLYIFSRAILGKNSLYWKYCYIPSVLCIGAIITNPLHYLFYSKYTFLSDSFGPIFYFHFIVTYVFSLLAIINLIYGAIKNREKKRSAISLFVGAMFPLFVNMNYVLDFLNPMFDITPIAYNASLIVMGYAAFNYDFFNFIPGVVSKSLNTLPGAIVINNSVYGSDKNQICKRSKNTKYCIEVDGLKLKINRFVSIDEIKRDTQRLESTLIETDKKHKALIKEINIRTQKLINEERIKIAGEVHDILGYSISSIISLLEICRFKNVNGLQYQKIINKALEVANSGLKELSSNSSKELKWREDFYRLLSEVGIHNLETESYIDNDINLNDNFYKLFYKVLKESITNCLKYGKATKIQITLAIIRNNINFNIINNGQGCLNIEKGTGLKNIEERVKRFNGSVNFYSDPGCGFQTSISIPYMEDCYLEECSEKKTLSKLVL